MTVRPAAQGYAIAVPAREQAGERKLQRSVFADDDAAELLEDQRQSSRYGNRVALGGSHGHRQNSPLQAGLTVGATTIERASRLVTTAGGALHSVRPLVCAGDCSPALHLTQEITR